MERIGLGGVVAAVVGAVILLGVGHEFIEGVDAVEAHDVVGLGEESVAVAFHGGNTERILAAHHHARRIGRYIALVANGLHGAVESCGAKSLGKDSETALLLDYVGDEIFRGHDYVADHVDDAVVHFDVLLEDGHIFIEVYYQTRTGGIGGERHGDIVVAHRRLREGALFKLIGGIVDSFGVDDVVVDQLAFLVEGEVAQSQTVVRQIAAYAFVGGSEERIVAVGGEQAPDARLVE